MTGATSHAAIKPPSIMIVVLAATAAQIAAAMGIAIFPVLAPQLALMLGVDASTVGYLISLLFGAAMLASTVVGTVVLRWGACRGMQWALWLAAAGMLIALAGSLWAMPLAALFIGSSNALAAAAAAHLLFRFAPPRHRNLIFSIKQTGVPLGWALIALVAPVLTLRWGWRVSLIAVLVYAVAAALLFERWRRFWDDDRDPRAAGRTSLLTGVIELWRYPVLRYLGLAAFFFSFLQLCVGTFTVNLLVKDVGYSLVAAGLMLSLVQAAGMAGRLGFGWIADRSGKAIGALTVTSLCAAAGCVVCLSISTDWPPYLLALFYLAFGIVSYGWNGVMHAQIARLSPPGMVSVVTGGVMIWIFAGILIGPSLFAATYRMVGSYTTTFAFLSAAGIASALLAGRAASAERRG
ncbi:MAG: MFS transporter [Betaproteobacteria bacterium]|jgi:MFS family permease|nr:MFS transporter [Betaproteobacteria bacterium]